jgi:hypothetical protein
MRSMAALRAAQTSMAMTSASSSTSASSTGGVPRVTPISSTTVSAAKVPIM